MVDIVSAAPLGIGSPPNLATGSFIGSGNSASLVLGFMPRSVTIFNETGGIIWEKLQGMTPANCFKSGVLDTTGAVLFPTDVGLNEPGSTVLLSAAACPAGALISFAVLG